MEFRVIRSSQFPDEKPRNVKNIYEKGDGWYIKINTLEELKAKEKYDNMLKRKNKETERLNNIIDKLEKKIISICETCYEDRETARIEKWIKELKGESNE